MKNKSLKYIARTKTAKAIKSGKLIRPEFCTSCKTGQPVEAHHPDYNKPLNVMWLCRKCHRQWHKKHGYQKKVGNTVVIFLNYEKSEYLEKISKKNHRTKSGHVRWLIDNEIKQFLTA